MPIRMKDIARDLAAVGAMNAVLEAGLRIPGDVAVIGCGNVHYDASLRVPLSSVDQQSTAMGERAGKLVLSLTAAKGSPKPKSIILDPKLVARASTRRNASA